ncbi:MAG: hypothetical protein IBX45_00335 [Campylobacterales bacterium]|nr:hypothetical protein [Campylobacterales bacterium]
MILAFEFHYVSHNGVLENFLFQALEENPLPFSLEREGGAVTLCVEGEEAVLIDFSERLSRALPLSLYFKSLHVKVVEALGKGSMKRPACEVALPFTPQMLTRVMDTYNPFTPPAFGKNIQGHEPLRLTKEKNFLTSQTTAFKEIFAAAAQMAQENPLHVKTTTGWVRLEVLTCKASSFDETSVVVPCDLSVVEKMVVIKEDEIKALASLEKPILRLPINAIFAAKDILPVRFVNLKMADDLVLYLLCTSLFAQGVEFVVLTPCEPTEENALTYEGGEFREPIGVVVLENGEIIPTFGQTYTNPLVQKSAQAFEEKSHGHFAALLKEHHLFDASVACFYLSRHHDDAFMVYQEALGMVDLVKVEFPDTIGAILDAIKESGSSGERLVANFTKAHPERVAFARELTLAGEPKSVATLMGVAGVLFGYANTVQEATSVMLEHAMAFSGLKGPRIDYLLEGETLKGTLNPMRVVRSGMSYHLADLDALTLSFGYVDSLGYFISDTLDRMKEEFKTTHTGFCGGLFANRRMAEVAARQARVSHTVCFNRELPLDT